MNANPEHQPPDLPDGTVTLLFSDIEGSTALLKRLGDGWPDVLDRQRRLLREAIAGGNGVVVDCQGDAMFAAFRSAPAGVAAAIAAQRGHALEQWPDGTKVRVRMALHTGEPHRTSDGGYTGIDVVRAARLCAAGHGGQVLMTETTRGISRAEAIELGSTRLPDMDGPEPVYQLVRARPGRGVSALAADGGVASRDTRAWRPAPRQADRPRGQGFRAARRGLGGRPARARVPAGAAVGEAEGHRRLSGGRAGYRRHMTENDEQQVKPSEQRGGTTPDDAELREKGPWAETAAEGIVPAELRGSDASPEQLADDPRLGSDVLGETTGSDEPATEGGIDPAGGDAADATTDGGPELPEDAEPDLKDAPAASRRPD